MQLLLYFGFTALQCHIIKLLYAGGGFIPLIHTLGQPLPRSKIYLAILGCTHATNNDDDAKYESFINIVRLGSPVLHGTCLSQSPQMPVNAQFTPAARHDMAMVLSVSCQAV